MLASAQTRVDDPRALLEGSPFIRFNRQAWVGRLIDDWLQKNRIHVREVMELDTLEAIATMVFHGLGVSIVPRRCVPSPAPLPLTRVALHAPDHTRILGLIMRADCPARRQVEVLAAALVAQVREARRASHPARG